MVCVLVVCIQNLPGAARVQWCVVCGVGVGCGCSRSRLFMYIQKVPCHAAEVNRGVDFLNGAVFNLGF